MLYPCEGNILCKRIFVTHHKTGHHLCSGIANAFAKESDLNFYDLSTASSIPSDADIIVYESKGTLENSSYKFESYGGDLKLQDLKFLGIHVIRHPYEIIASAYRWHKKIDRPWVHEEWEDAGMTYKENLMRDGISFDDRRFLTLKLEDFNDHYEATISRIARHLKLSEKLLLQTSQPFNLHSMPNYPTYVTRKTTENRTYLDLFQPHHYDLFRQLFPSDILTRLGY